MIKLHWRGVVSGLALILTSTAHAQPTEWQWTPTNASGVILGQATINGAPAESADWIGAFDPAGNCAGAAPIIVNEGLAYFNLPIYGDDVSTADLDEGITAGEPFTLRIWQAASNSFATYPNDDAPEYLDGWSNTNGAPIPDYGDPTVNYEFSLVVNVYIVCPEATCLNGPVQTLEWGPPGGVISGPGVAGVYWDPLTAGVGVHTLTYSLDDTEVSCTVEVTETPDATISPVSPLCANVGAIQLEAATAGGTWSGTGVLGAFFDPGIAGPGNHAISYAAGEGNGCDDSATITIVVYPALSPPQIELNGNGTGLLAINAGGDPVSWQWHHADGTPVEGQSSMAFDDPVDGEMYFVSATNNYGCSANSDIITFIFPAVSEWDESTWRVWYDESTGRIESHVSWDECRVYRSNGQWVQTIYQDQPYLTGESDAGSLYIVQCRQKQAAIHFKLIK